MESEKWYARQVQIPDNAIALGVLNDTENPLATLQAGTYPSVMRYLGIDLGDKRTGLAIGDDETGIATPLVVIETSDGDLRLQQIAEMVDQQRPDALVVGLPLNMDGSEGQPAAKTRSWVAELTAHLHLPVHLVDERLTSFDADQKLRGSGLTRKQKNNRHDALAAAAILNEFLQNYTP